MKDEKKILGEKTGDRELSEIGNEMLKTMEVGEVLGRGLKNGVGISFS